MSALLLLLALLLAPFAAAAAPEPAGPVPPQPAAAHPAPASTESYGALGTEPFWGLGIRDGRLDFDLNETEIVYSAPAPAREAAPNGFVYRTPRLVAEIRHEECNDGMTDRTFADTVVVTIDGRRLDGCGGDILPPESLAETGWRIDDIAGRHIGRERGDFYSVSFDEASAQVFTACGAFTGPWSVEGDRLTTRLNPFRPTGFTFPDGEVLTEYLDPAPRYCTSADRENQVRLLQILGAPVQIRFTPDGNFLMTGEGGSVTLSR
jgi:uncharacterized membrane protein